MLSVADCPTGYASRVILVDEMRTRFPPRLRGAYCIFEGDLFIINVFLKILVYNFTLKKFGMYKKLCKGVLKL